MPLQVTLDGLDISANDGPGARFILEQFDGWGSPASTIRPQQRSRQHGMWAGDAWLEGRPLELAGKIDAPSQDEARLAFDALAAAASLETVTLEVNEGGAVRSVGVRREGAVLHRWITDKIISWSISLVATDPRKTAAALSGSTGLPSSSGGFSFPLTFPFSIDATTVSGQVSLTNPGNIAGKVVLRIDGPVTGPVVTHVSSGRSLVFAASLTIPEGNFVLVDMEARTVLENGIASRNGWVTQRGWSAFEPGPNTWAFSAPSHDDGTLTVYATPSWM